MASDGSIELDLLVKDLSDATLKQFTEKAKKAYDEAQKPFDSPITAKLEAEADEMGIKNFGRMIDELPKEKRTELIAKAQKAEVDSMMKAIDTLPKEKRSELKAMVESGKVKNFQELIHHVPEEHRTAFKASYEDAKVNNYQKLLKSLPSKLVTKLDIHDQASPKLRKVAAEAEKTEGKFSSLKRISAGAFLGNLGAMAATKAIGAVTGAMDGAIKRVDTLANSQRTFENLNISARDTEKGMKKLNDAIDGLPTALDSAVSGTTMLVSATKDMDKSVDVFKAVNDGVLGFGGSAENVDSMVTSLSKSLAAGKITGETLASMYDNKLGPVVGEVAKKMGMTQAQLTEAASKGEVDINKFQDALIDLDKNGSGSLKSLDQIAKDSTKGIGTSMQNMRSAITRSVGHVIEGMGPALIKKFDNMKDMLNSMKPVFKDVGEVFGAVFGTINDFTGMFMTSLKVNVNIPMEETGDKVLSLKDKILKFLDGIKPVAQAIAGFFGVVIGGAISTVGTFVKSIVGGFNDANSKAEEAKNAFDFSGIARSISRVSQFLNGWYRALVQIYEPLGQIVGIMVGGVFEMFADIIGGIANMFKSTGEGAEESEDSINGVAQALQAIADHKDALKIVAQTLATMWLVGKAKAFADMLFLVSKGIWATTLAMKANPIGLIITGITLAIAALVVGLYQLYKHREAIGKFFSDIGQAMGEFFGGLGKWFGEAWDATKKFFDDITKPIREFFDGLGKWFGQTGTEVSNFFNDIGTTIGEFFGGLRKWFDKGLEAISSFFSDMWEAVKDGFDKVVEFISGYIDMVAGFWTKVAEIVGRGLILVLALFVGIGMIIYEAVIQPIIDVLVDFAKWVADKFMEFVDNMMSWFSDMGKAISEVWQSIWEPISEFLGEVFDTIKELVGDGIQAVSETLEEVGAIIAEVWEMIWNPIGDFLSDTWNGMVRLVSRMIKNIQKIIDGVTKSIQKAWRATWKVISKFFSDTWNSMSKVVNRTIKSIQKIINSVTKSIQKAWQAVWKSIKKFFSDVWTSMQKHVDNIIKKIQSGISAFGKAVSGIWKGIWNPIKSFFGDIWDGMHKKVTGIWDKMKSGVSSFGKAFSDAWNNIWNPIVDGFTSIWENIKDIAAKGWNGITGIINKGIGGINSVISMFGGSSEAIKPIAQYANGTQGAARGLAMVNDGNGPELILDNNGGAHILEGRNRLVHFSGGETVVPHEQTMSLLGGHIPRFNSGTPGWANAIQPASLISSVVDGAKGAVGWVAEKGSDLIKWGADKWNTFKEIISNPLKFLTNILTGFIESGIGALPEFAKALAPAIGNGFVKGITAPFKALIEKFKPKKGKDKKKFADGGWGGDEPGIFNEVPGQREIVINPHRGNSDEHIEQAIAKRAMLAPESSTARLAQVINMAKSGRDSMLNSQITGSHSQTNSIASSNIDLSGDVELVVQLDSDVVAKATYPKIKLLQDTEIQLAAQANGLGGMQVGY